jgi:hypothetical protein
MKSPAHQDRAGRRRWLSLTLAGVVGASLLAAALSLCVAVLPQRLYPPLSNADLTGLSPADQAARREGRDRLQNDARTTLLQGLAALLVLGGAGIGAAVTLRQVRIGREQLEHARQQASAATTAPTNNSSSPANRRSVATSVCVSRSPWPRKARSPTGSPALSTNRPARSRSARRPPGRNLRPGTHRARLPNPPAGCSRDPHRVHPQPRTVAAPLARPIPRRCAY